MDAATLGTLLLLLVAFIALLTGRHWGFGAATYGSAGFVLLSALCPVWDHHQIGSWWIGQSTISIAMLAGSMIQRSRVARARPRESNADALLLWRAREGVKLTSGSVGTTEPGA